MADASIRGAAELNARLNAIKKAGRPLLHELQLGTTAEAKRLVPRKTGNLGRSIAPGYITDKSALVIARAGYAAYVELGTKPHVIRPRNASTLRFPAAGTATTLSGRVRSGATGGFVFAGKVNHPGTRKQPFLLPGAKKAARDRGLPDTIVKLWNRAA